MSGELTRAIADLQEKEALRLAHEALGRGDDPHSILEESRKGMELVGQRFGDGTYFLPELIFSAEILREVSTIVKPHLKRDMQVERVGKCIIGTVAGDIHDLGKDIVAFMLDVSVRHSLFVEYVPALDRVLEEPLELKDGDFEVPKEPGLGVRFDREKLKRYKVE